MLERNVGDAVIFKATFKDNGVLVDPSSTTGKVYDSAGTLLFTFTSLVQESTGVYTATWQTSGSTTKGDIFFEASGIYGAATFLSKNKLVRMV